MRKNGCLECSPSLARMFGLWPSVAVTLSMALAHTLFALGQFKNLYHYSVAYALNGVTADIDFKFFGHHKYNVTFDVANNFTLLGESYNSTLHDLWSYNTENAWLNGDPNFSYNMNAPYILFFCLLIMSGLWPHCKLLAVHLLWYVPANPKHRKRSLWWLDFFGKYSMTDVFAMLTMVSWAQIHAISTTKGAITSAMENLPGFLVNQTNATVLAEGLCKHLNQTAHFVCENLVEYVTNHPDKILDHLQFSRLGGDLDLGLNVVTDSGLYFFSTAVWATLLISAGVNLAAEHLESKQRKKEATYFALEDPTSRTTISEYSTLVTGLPCYVKVAILTLVLAWGCSLVGGLLVPMVTRTLYGTIVELAEIPSLLGDSQINAKYNLLDTMRDVGLGGGGNAFLQKDLAAFTIIFPFLMVVVASIALFVPMKSKIQTIFAEAVKFCFSFSGWEILIIVTIVMTSELQALTVTIPAGVDGGVSMCRELASLVINAPRGGVCFEEDLDIEAAGFACICAGAVGMIFFRLLIPFLHDRRQKPLFS